MALTIRSVPTDLRDTPQYKKKMHSDNRIISLTPIDGKPSNTTGLVDTRLFTGENQLHAISHPSTGLWYLQYEHGILPAALKQQFTGFNKLMTFITDYFNRRNIEVKEVLG